MNNNIQTSQKSSSSSIPDGGAALDGCNFSSDQVNELVNSAKKSYEERLKATEKVFSEEIKKARVEIDNIKSETKNLKLDFIAVIGIFVSIFTFISIEIQILKYISDFFRIAGFSLIIFGAMTGFIILIHSILTPKNIPKSFWILSLSSFVLGIIIGSIPYFSDVSVCRLCNDSEQKVLQEVDN